MCGIFAAASAASYVSLHLRGMFHRGPDGAQIVSAGGMHSGFTRLAIVGVNNPHAEQPRWTRKGRVLAFNGELYNYRNLLPDALSEVHMLGELLDEGLDPRQFIDGDYAIYYFDPSNHTVTLYRDRFGFCPLYYQLKPFVAVSSERRRLIHAREVPPHGKVVIDTKLKRVTETSRFEHYGVVASASPLPVFDLLEEAVASRALHSDVGFSLALSGGIDSSLIALLCHSWGLKPKVAVNVALSAGSFDLYHARKVADKIGCEFISFIPSRDEVRAALPHIREHLDITGSYTPTPLKWRMALRNWFVAANCKTPVILCGEGSDEMVEGYPPHTSFYATRPMRALKKQMSAVRTSLPVLNLDQTNKIGLAHSKEFRAPFLASTLSYYLLSAERRPGKQVLRSALRRLGASDELVNRSKWSSDESTLDTMLEQLVKETFQ